jgi:hypothetical protein
MNVLLRGGGQREPTGQLRFWKRSLRGSSLFHAPVARMTLLRRPHGLRVMPQAL